MAKPSVWLIAGPTASGKSGLALALAECAGAEVVNADALQVYRDLAVLTARPTVADLARAPHQLYGVADAAEAWSAGRWLRAAETALAQIAARGRPAIVVGGTGLYLRALTEGLSEVPPVPPAIRGEADATFAREGEAAFRARLAGVDPEAESRIAPGDRQRLVRAMSVALATGRPLTRWQAKPGEPPLAGWRAVVLEPPRETLYARCDARLGSMLEHGALSEVAALMARGLDPGLPAMKALGAPEFAAHLRGESTLDQALAAARQSTRRYAKRQTTWFRNQTPDWPRLASADPDAALKVLNLSA
jgi:tRNA dimethylallyltransferase